MKKRDEMLLLFGGEMQRTEDDLLVLIRLHHVLNLVVVFDDRFDGLELSCVHVRGATHDIAQGRCFELTLGLGSADDVGHPVDRLSGSCIIEPGVEVERRRSRALDASPAPEILRRVVAQCIASLLL